MSRALLSRPGARCPVRRGFTLIEILAAAAIAGLILFLAGHVMMTAMKGQERIHATAQDLAAVRRAHEQMARDMHSAIVPPDDSGLQFGLTTTGAGQGTNVLQFAAVVSEPLLSQRQSNETALIQYSIAEDPRTGKPVLWRYETAYPVPEGSQQGGLNEDTRALPLLPGVIGASYLFYDSSQATWIDSWDGMTGLPAAIRVDLLFPNPINPDGDPRQESWIFSLPASKFANEEANAAAAAAEAEGTTTTPAGGGTP